MIIAIIVQLSPTPPSPTQPLPSVEAAFCSANRTLPLEQLTTSGTAFEEDGDKETIHDQIGITLPASIRQHGKCLGHVV